MADTDLATWLEDMQQDLGITYEPDEAEQRLRAAFSLLCQTGITGGVLTVAYYGSREILRADGTRRRTTIRSLHASIALPDGSKYALELVGPYTADTHE